MVFEETMHVELKEVEALLSCSSLTANRVLDTLLKEFKIRAVGNARATYYMQS